jgi:hypothetical protein
MFLKFGCLMLEKKMNNLITIMIVFMVGGIVFIIIRTMKQFKEQIDNKMKEIGPLKPNESIDTVVNKVLGRHVDPLKFNDSVAAKTSWSPAKKGGTNTQTHTLIDVNTSRLEFKASPSAKFIPIIFILTGFGLPIGFSANNIIHGTFSLNLMTVPPIVVGFILIIIAGVMWYLSTSPIIFDKTKGYFWKGRNDPLEISENSDPNRFANLRDIHALQLISETCWRNEDRTYRSHELNLVLKDSTRINVVDHGAKENIRECAHRLSQFLEKPVWDALSD